MNRVACCYLLVLAAVVLSAAPASAWQLCPLQTEPAFAAYDLPGSSIRISGTHYDTAGNATRIACDSTAGDQVWVMTGGGTPPGVDVAFANVSQLCTPLRTMVEMFGGFGTHGTEVQVVKNGVPKRECAGHGGNVYLDSSLAAYLVTHTVRKFDSAGKPTIEKGSYTINSYDGQIFIGKILIRYP